MCQTGSRKCAADSIDIHQLHYLNAECLFWVLYYISMVLNSHFRRKPVHIISYLQQVLGRLCLNENGDGINAGHV